MVYGFKVEGKEACFVVELSDKGEKNVLSINLYGKDVATYDDFYAIIQRLEETVGLKNKDPQSHESIHKKMGELMGCDPDSTKTPNTHFHWVCAEPLDMDGLGGFLHVLVRAKKLTNGQVLTALGEFGNEH